MKYIITKEMVNNLMNFITYKKLTEEEAYSILQRHNEEIKEYMTEDTDGDIFEDAEEMD